MHRDEPTIVERLISHGNPRPVAQLPFDGRAAVTRKLTRHRFLTRSLADHRERSIRQLGYSARKDGCSWFRLLGAKNAGNRQAAHQQQRGTRVSDHFIQNKWKPLNPGAGYDKAAIKPVSSSRPAHRNSQCAEWIPARSTGA